MYYSMDNKLMAYINDKDMYMHILDRSQEPKIAQIKGQEQMVDIMRLQPVITKEQFEATIPTNTSWEAFYKSLYLASIS